MGRENSTFAGIIGEHNVKVVICIIVLAVACAKAMFVMLYFMHLKFEGKWKFVLLAPTIVLAMAIPAALMPDIGSHYYDYEVPQLEPEEDAAIAAEGKLVNAVRMAVERESLFPGLRIPDLDRPSNRRRRETVLLRSGSSIRAGQLFAVRAEGHAPDTARDSLEKC